MDEKILTVELLKKMEPGIFATGTVKDSPEELHMAGTGRPLRWVAVRGGIHDWCIYCHFAYNSAEWIRNHGDKVCGTEHIRKLVLCDDEAFAMYRY